MLDLIVVSFELKSSGDIEILTKPLHPCKTDPVTPVEFDYVLFPGVSLKGPVSLQVKKLVPNKILIAKDSVIKSHTYTLAPWYFISRYTGLKIESLGTLIDEEKKYSEATSRKDLPSS